MNYAKIDKSPRLQKIVAVLADGRWHSTLDIAQRTLNCAVGTSIVEIRRNGVNVSSRQSKTDSGTRIWEYCIEDAT